MTIVYVTIYVTLLLLFVATLAVFLCNINTDVQLSIMNIKIFETLKQRKVCVMTEEEILAEALKDDEQGYEDYLLNNLIYET